MDQADVEAGHEEGLTTDEPAELVRLRRENRGAGDGDRCPQAGIGVIRAGERPPNTVTPLVHELAADGCPVAVTCRALNVSTSTYYDWLRGRPSSSGDVADANLLDAIIDIHRTARGTYGVRRAHAELTLGRELKRRTHTEPPGQPKADDEGEEAEDVVRHRVPGLHCVQAEPFFEPESGRHKPVDKDAWVLHPRYCAARANGQGDHSSAPPGTAAATSSDLTSASGAEVVGSFGGPPHPAFAPSAPPATRPARGGSGEITTYLVLGVDLQLVGGLLLVSGLVAGVASSFDTGESDSGLGTVFVLLLEWAATIAGTFCLLVGVIAKCVQIGNRAT